MNDERSVEASDSTSGVPSAPSSPPTEAELRERLETSTAERSVERRRLTDHLLGVQAELNAMSRQRQAFLAKRRRTTARHAAEIEDLTEKVVTLRYQRDLARWRLARSEQRRWWRMGAALGGLRRNPARFPMVLLEVLRILSGSSRPAPLPPKPEEPPTRPLTAPAEEPDRDADRTFDGPQTPRRLLAVATALDEESETRLSYEWVSQPLTPENWTGVLRDARPDLLLVNDAGWDLVAAANGGEQVWWDVLGAAREAGVPTAFWETRRLASTAVDPGRADRFDLIACSFAETVEAYRAATSHDQVHRFEPAVQTRWFRPAPAERRGDVLGLRSLAAPSGDGPLIRVARSLAPVVDIEGDLRTRFGDGPASAELAGDYKAAVTALSTATDEREIRHLLETVATRTLVMAGGTLPPELDGIVFDASTADEAQEALKTLLRSDELRDRLAHRAWRQVRSERALSPRVDELLAELGLATPSPLPKLTMMVPTNRPHKLTTIMDNLGRQTYPELSVVLALHGVDIDEGLVQDLAAERGLEHVEVLRVPEEVALGDVFNRGFAACDGDFVGKMDDDDHYGPHYASDLLADFEGTSADIVGKWAHYAYSEALDATLLRYPDSEHRYTDLLAISTLIMRPEVLDQVQFLPMEKGSGSQFLRAAGALGARVYAGNRFSYLYNRYSRDGHQHTWPVAEYEFASKSRFVCQGQNLAAVDA